MCDVATKVFNQLKHLQVRVEPNVVKCTCSTNCWCNDLSFRFPLTQTPDECMSPAEMLKLYGHDMTNRDRAYLERLAKLPFESDMD